LFDSREINEDLTLSHPDYKAFCLQSSLSLVKSYFYYISLEIDYSYSSSSHAFYGDSSSTSVTSQTISGEIFWWKLWCLITFWTGKSFQGMIEANKGLDLGILLQRWFEKWKDFEISLLLDCSFSEFEQSVAIEAIEQTVSLPLSSPKSSTILSTIWIFDQSSLIG